MNQEDPIVSPPSRLPYSIAVAAMTFFALVFVGLMLIGATAMWSKYQARKAARLAASATAPAPAPTSDLSGSFTKKDLKLGTGRVAGTGDKLEVHYKGTLVDGTTFDSSYDRGTPFSFELGKRQVIEGWESGVPGMKVGGKRRLRIPPRLAYGSRGQGQIPPDATLIFEIELLSIK